MFRILDEEEVLDFQQYAHDNWTPSANPSSVWHPVVRDEWTKMSQLSLAVATVYEQCAPDINAAPSNVDAHDAAEVTADAFTTHATPEDIALWHHFPHNVRAAIVHQTVGEYY